MAVNELHGTAIDTVLWERKDPQMIENYHSIALTSTIEKTLEEWLISTCFGDQRKILFWSIASRFKVRPLHYLPVPMTSSL